MATSSSNSNATANGVILTAEEITAIQTHLSQFLSTLNPATALTPAQVNVIDGMYPLVNRATLANTTTQAHLTSVQRKIDSSLTAASPPKLVQPPLSPTQSLQKNVVGILNAGKTQNNVPNKIITGPTNPATKTSVVATGNTGATGTTGPIGATGV